MTITQVENKLTIISQETSGYEYIHVVQDVTIHETVIVSSEFTNSISYYTLPTDGYYIVSEIKLPTTSSSGYYISGDAVVSTEIGVITVKELMNIDTTGTNIVKNEVDHISMYYLEDYYLKLLKSKYLKNICNCGCGCIDRQDKVKLDTLTMGLDLIEALTLTAQYFEIQRIVEKLSVCFGMVKNDCNCS